MESQIKVRYRCSSSRYYHNHTPEDELCVQYMLFFCVILCCCCFCVLRWMCFFFCFLVVFCKISLIFRFTFVSYSVAYTHNHKHWAPFFPNRRWPYKLNTQRFSYFIFSTQVISCWLKVYIFLEHRFVCDTCKAAALIEIHCPSDREYSLCTWSFLFYFFFTLSSSFGRIEKKKMSKCRDNFAVKSH